MHSNVQEVKAISHCTSTSLLACYGICWCLPFCPKFWMPSRDWCTFFQQQNRTMLVSYWATLTLLHTCTYILYTICMQQKRTETEFWLHAFLANALSAMTNKCDNFLPYFKNSKVKSSLVQSNCLCQALEVVGAQTYSPDHQWCPESIHTFLIHTGQNWL